MVSIMHYRTRSLGYYGERVCTDQHRSSWTKVCGVGQDWRAVAPNNAVLATSVVAIVVRQGNPKAIRDWDDLTR
jgi:hypothetical protein